MKLLRIDEKVGYFLDAGGGFSTVDKITKEDLLRLVGVTLEGEVEFDECEADSIANQAQQIIYKSVLEKLTGLALRREQFKDESARRYLPEHEKYRAVPTVQEAAGGTAGGAS